ncbi:unnamed protein product, partial [Meganyctiphanes norvegica]
MSFLIGNVSSFPGKDSPFDIFYALATKPESRNKVALHTDEGPISFGSLLEIVENFQFWLEDILNNKCTTTSLQKHHVNLEENSCSEKKEYSQEFISVYKDNLIEVEDNHISIKINNDVFEKVNLLLKKDVNNSNGHNDNISNEAAHSAKLDKPYGFNINDRKETGLKTICICLNHSPKLVALILSIWSMGYAYVPIDPALPTLKTTLTLQQVQPMCLISDSEYIKDLQSIKAERVENSNKNESLHYLSSHIYDINIEKCSYKEKKIIKENVSVRDKTQYQAKKSKYPDIATVLYTSGSTGAAKGVKISSRSLLNRLYWQWKTYPYDSSDVCLFSKSLTFVDSLTELFGPLLSGVPVVIIKELTINPELIVHYVFKFNITRLIIVPSMLKILVIYLNTSPEILALLQKAVKLWVLSGEVLPAWLLNDFFVMFPGSQVVNLYGSTEVMGDVTYFHADEKTWRNETKVAIGCPIDNTGVLLIRSEEDDIYCVNKGESGEIVVIGENICQGYIGKSSKSKAFIPVSSIKFENPDYQRTFRIRLKKMGEIIVNSTYTCTETKKLDDLQNKSNIGKILNNGVDKKNELTHSIKKCEAPPKANNSEMVSFIKTFSPKLCRKTVPIAFDTLTSKLKNSSIFNLSDTPINTTCEKNSDQPSTDCPAYNSSCATSNSCKSAVSNITSEKTREVTDGSKIFESKRDYLEYAYLTGDYATIVGGQLIFDGRKDSQIKVRGIRIDLSEIESAIHHSRYCSSHWVHSVFPEEGVEDEPLPVAFVVLKKDFEDREKEATEELLQIEELISPHASKPKIMYIIDIFDKPHSMQEKGATKHLYNFFKNMPKRHVSKRVLIASKSTKIKIKRKCMNTLGIKGDPPVRNGFFFIIGRTKLDPLGPLIISLGVHIEENLMKFNAALPLSNIVELHKIFFI